MKHWRCVHKPRHVHDVAIVAIRASEHELPSRLMCDCTTSSFRAPSYCTSVGVLCISSNLGAVWFSKIQPAPDSSANRSGSHCLFETLRNWIPWNPLRAQFRGDTARSGAISVNDTERQHEKESSVASAAPLDPRVRTKQNLSLP